MHAHFEGSRAGIFDGGDAELLGQREDAQDAADTRFAELAINKVAECADVSAGSAGSPQQLGDTQRSVFRVVLFLDAIPAAFLAHMFPQQQTVVGIEDTNVEFVPLHSDQASDPARGQAVVGGLDFDTTVQMHDPLAILVVAERFQGQREQERFFFGKHGRDLPFGGAVDARIGATGFP